MPSTTLSAYLRISGPGYSYHDTLGELASLSGKLTFPLGNFGTAQPGVEVLEPTEAVQDKLAQEIESFQATKQRILSITASVPLPDERLEVDNEGEAIYFEGEPAEQIYKQVARVVFEKRVYDLIVSTNIARVGSLEVPGGWLVQEGETHRLDDMSGAYLLAEAIEYIQEFGWPKLYTLSVAKVWDWVLDQEGFMEGFGGGPTGRALNALTQLFGLKQDLASHLFWLLVGIEAIYTKGQGSLQEQVKEKSQTLLGKQETHKKKIGQLYGFRSRFVHGDLDFAGRHMLTMQKKDK